MCSARALAIRSKAAATRLPRSVLPNPPVASASSAAALADEPLLFGLAPTLESVDSLGSNCFDSLGSNCFDSLGSNCFDSLGFTCFDSLGSTCFAHYWHDSE